MIDFITHPGTLFIISLILFFGGIILYNRIKNIFRYLFLIIALLNTPIIVSSFTIHYISEYGRNIPDIDITKIEKCKINKLLLKQDDDSEYHYRIYDKHGVSSDHDVDNHYDLDIYFIDGESYSVYETKIRTYRDWAQYDRVITTTKLIALYISNDYDVVIFDD